MRGVHAGEVAHFPAAIFDLVERALDPAEKRGAVARERDRAAVTDEEFDAHVVFEPGDRAAERGLGDPEFVGGARHVLELRDRAEVDEPIPIHALCLLDHTNGSLRHWTA